jgi:dTDP-4-amino-4,6-dideoxygalactose transaminase
MAYFSNNFRYPLQNTKLYNKKFKTEFESIFQEYLESGEYILGKYVTRFENSFARYLDVKYALGVNNCTNALELCFRVLNGGDIIIQANTFIANALGASMSGRNLILCDVDKNGILDLDILLTLITKKTRVVLVTHLYGDCCNMIKLVDICKKHNLLLVEDCAQSTGSKYGDKMLGSFGDVACHSFYPSKNLGALGDGGMITTNNLEFYEQFKLIRNLGSSRKYVFDIKGTNIRPSAIQFAMLNIKLADLDSAITYKKSLANLYTNTLDKTKYRHICNDDHKIYHSYHLYVIELYVNRDKLIKYLAENGIESIIHYPTPFYKTNAFIELNNNTCVVTESLSNNILSLPIDYTMSVDDILNISKILNNFN